MTKWAIFDKLKKWKKYTGLSENDKIEHFWQNWRSKIIEITYCTYTISHNLNSTFSKMTKWAFGDNIEKWKNTRASQKMTKLSIFDKIVWWLTTYGVEKSYLSHNLKTAFPKWQNGPFLTKIEKLKKCTGLSENDKIEHFWQNWRSEKIHEPLTKWQNWAFLTKMKKRKNPWASHKMTKLSIFDKNEEAKKYTSLSQNDKIEHFWQKWRSEKIHGPLTKWQNWAFLTKLKNRKIHSPLRKWQNWAFLTKLKKRKNPRSSHKMTKLSIFDTFEEAKKTTRSSHKMTKFSIFDKIEEAKKTHGPLRKWQNGAFLTKLKNWKKYTSLSQNDKIKHFWQNWRSEKNPRSSHKMTKLSIFDKIEEAKKSTGLSENDKMEHFWQKWKSEKI